MGMPVITPGEGSREQAITDLIQSVALQEAALSHILNAEGEKMQAIIARPQTTPKQLLELNGSVNRLVNTITNLEMMFQTKLSLVIGKTSSGPAGGQNPPEPPDPPVQETTAEQELDKINVTFVRIDIPLDDPGAQQAAVGQAIAKAQRQAEQGYTVSFEPTDYSPGKLTGRFTVKSNSNPTDTKTDSANRTITVISATASTPVNTAASNAEAQFISGSLLGADLTEIAELGGASAHFEDGITPGENDTDTVRLKLNVFGQSLININNIQLPMSDLLKIGVVNQYAQASPEGVSRAFSGAVSNDGILSIGGSDDFPADAKFDLMKLIPSTPFLSTANISLGAISGAAQWDAKLGDTPAETTGIQDPVQGRAYHIAGAALNLESPAIGKLVSAINTAVTTLNGAVNSLGTIIQNGILDGIKNSLDTLAAIPIVGEFVGSVVEIGDLTVLVTLDLPAALAPVISEPIISEEDGSLRISLAEGAVNVDLNKLLGGTLNGMPPNTDLLSPEAIQAITGDLNSVITMLSKTLSNLLEGVLSIASVTISGDVALAAGTIGVGVNFSGTLGELLTGTKPLEIVGTGVLGPLIAPAAGAVVSMLQAALNVVLNPLLSDPGSGNIIAAAGEAVTTAVNTLATGLSPVFSLINSVISLKINVQEDNAEANTFTEIPVQFNLLSDGATLNLGKVVVGSNTYPMII